MISRYSNRVWRGSPPRETCRSCMCSCTLSFHWARRMWWLLSLTVGCVHKQTSSLLSQSHSPMNGGQGRRKGHRQMVTVIRVGSTMEKIKHAFVRSYVPITVWASLPPRKWPLCRDLRVEKGQMCEETARSIGGWQASAFQGSEERKG